MQPGLGLAKRGFCLCSLQGQWQEEELQLAINIPQPWKAAQISMVPAGPAGAVLCSE